jgi:hypothetical protein
LEEILKMYSIATEEIKRGNKKLNVGGIMAITVI